MQHSFFIFLLFIAKSFGAEYCVCTESCFQQQILPRILVTPTNDTLIGYKDTMDELVNLLIKPIEQPDDFYGLLGSRRGLLLFGPPGTGDISNKRSFHSFSLDFVLCFQFFSFLCFSSFFSLSSLFSLLR